MSDIQTTNKETFSHAESCDLAWMLNKRFGRNTEAAAAAWRRMLQNSCTDTQFAEMVHASKLGRLNPPSL